jgi:hypothetical protein
VFLALSLQRMRKDAVEVLLVHTLWNGSYEHNIKQLYDCLLGSKGVLILQGKNMVHVLGNKVVRNRKIYDITIHGS